MRNGDAAGGYTRGSAPHSELEMSMLAGGKHTIISAFARSAPLCRILLVLFLTKQEKYDISISSILSIIAFSFSKWYDNTNETARRTFLCPIPLPLFPQG